MEICLAVYLDLLGTCILTDEVIHWQSIYLDDRSIPSMLSKIPVIPSFRTPVASRRENADSTFCPKILSVNSIRGPISSRAKAASKREGGT